MDIFVNIISKLLVLTILYAIIVKAMQPLRFRTKYLTLFFISLIFTLLFLCALIFDSKTNTISRNKFNYYSYIAGNSFMGLYSLANLIFRFRKNDFLRYSSHEKKTIERVSKVHYKEFLYILFEHNEEYLLRKENEMYSGMNIGLKKDKFHDDVIKSLLNKYNVTAKEIIKYGKYTIKNKKEIYHVYQISINEQLQLKNYELVHYSKIMYLNLSDLDKELIFRVILNEKFDIEI